METVIALYEQMFCDNISCSFVTKILDLAVNKCEHIVSFSATQL